MINPVPAGANVVTDNWTLQVVAGLLSGKDDPTAPAQWLAAGAGQKGASSGLLPAGVFQIECLVNLLEQLLFGERLFVMEGWTEAWAGKVRELDILLPEESGILQTLPFIDPPEFDRCKKQVLPTLLVNPGLEEWYRTGIGGFPRGVGDYWAQVVDGVADYLVLCQAVHGAYAPHPARLGFLRSTRWRMPELGSWRTKGIVQFNEIVDEARVRLTQCMRHGQRAVELAAIVPSAAALCLAESSDRTSPVEVALEMRDQEEVRELRKALHALTAANAEGDSRLIRKGVFRFEDSVKRAERALSGSGAGSGSSERNIGLDVIQIGDEDRGFITRLVESGAVELTALLGSKLHIDDPTVFEKLRWWNYGEGTGKLRETPEEDLLSRNNNVVVFYEGPEKLEVTMTGDTYNVEQAGAVGPGAKADNTVQYKAVSGLDLTELAEELPRLLQALQDAADSEEKHGQVAAVAEAFAAAKQDDAKGTLAALAKAGRWSLGVAEKIGVGVATKAIQAALGLD